MMDQIALIVISALLSAILAGAGAWLAFGRNVVDERDVRQIVADVAIARDDAPKICAAHSPYLKDRALLNASLDRIESRVDEIDRLARDTRDQVLECITLLRNQRRSGTG